MRANQIHPSPPVYRRCAVPRVCEATRVERKSLGRLTVRVCVRVRELPPLNGVVNEWSRSLARGHAHQGAECYI
jgi:hypothetical protein